MCNMAFKPPTHRANYGSQQGLDFKHRRPYGQKTMNFGTPLRPPAPHGYSDTNSISDTVLFYFSLPCYTGCS